MEGKTWIVTIYICIYIVKQTQIQYNIPDVQVFGMQRRQGREWRGFNYSWVPNPQRTRAKRYPHKSATASTISRSNPPPPSKQSQPSQSSKRKFGNCVPNWKVRFKLVFLLVLDVESSSWRRSWRFLWQIFQWIFLMANAFVFFLSSFFFYYSPFVSPFLFLLNHPLIILILWLGSV
jgi:ABC-type multidrug transport system fused ATPase/permease subunit